MPDALDDPDVRAAVEIIARRSGGRRVCPRCAAAYLASGQDRCTSCEAEVRELELAGKREWWARRGARSASKLERAKTWLASELRRGPVDSTVIRERADAVGIYPGTLRRAREQLRVDVERRGDGSTRWSL